MSYLMEKHLILGMLRGVMGLENFFLSYYVKYDLIWFYYNTCLNLINIIFSKLGGHLGIQNGVHKHKI